MAVLGPRERGHNPKRYTVSDIRRMQRWEELVCEAIVVLEGNVGVMGSLRRFYLGLKKNTDFPHRRSCADEIIDFADQLDAMIKDFNASIGRAKALVKIWSDWKS